MAALPIVLATRVSSGADPLAALGDTWRWRVFDREEGLVGASVSAIHQDQYEFIYAATERGISRYDLWEWSALENAQPFDDGEVTRFVEAASALFAVTSNALWRVESGTTLKLAFRGGGVHAAANDQGEVFAIDERSSRHLQFRGESFDPIDPEVRLPEGHILGYEIDAGSVHWLVTADGIFYRDMGRRVWREVEDRDLDPSLEGRRCSRLYRAEGPLTRDAEGRAGARGREAELWALFESSRGQPVGRALATLEKGTWTLTAVIDAPPFRHLVMDASHVYYATTDDGRLFASADGKDWRAAPPSGLGVGLHGGMTDSSGTIWFRLASGGAAAYDPRASTWERIPTGRAESFPNVLSLLETESGEVWLGMTKAVTRRSSAAEPEVFDRAQGVALEKVTGLGEDALHRVWVSSAESWNGALHFDPDDGSWARETRRGFEDYPIRRIVRDLVGELWFLSLEKVPEGGYSLYHLGLSTTYELEPVRVERGPVNDLAHTREGVYWLATDEGLLRCALDGGRLRTEKRFTDADGLLAIQVWAVAEGPDGAIWICYPSAASGVTRIKAGTMTSFQEADGLASPEVWSIAAAGQSLWFGTGRGLTRFDGECWYSYPVAGSEARASRVWPVISSRRDPDAVLLGTFGQGAFRFRLDDRRRPRFTRTSFPGRVDPGATASFTWDARDFRGQTRHDSLVYRSRIDGGTWSPFSRARGREVAGLAPGVHTVEVEARDLAGNRNRDELVHRFLVGEQSRARLAWIAAAAAAAVALAAFGYRARLRSARTSSLYRGFFRSAPGPAFILDGEGRVAEWNGVAPPWAGMDGARREDILGRPFHLLPPFYSEEARIGVRAALRGEESRAIERRFTPEGGAEVSLRLRFFPLRASGGAIRATAVLVEDGTRDTEGVRLRDREGRLASLRRFAGRVAEDSRVALRAAQEMQSRPADPFLVERLRRAEGLLARLEAFAGTGQQLDPAPQPLPLSDLLEKLAGGISSGAIKVDFRGQTGLWAASAPLEAIEGALGEILRNAVEAMPEKGVLTLRAANVRIDEALGALDPGSYVEVQVRDSGTGIEDARLERIFEPFQSTKPRDSAFGLGLAVAHSLVRKMGGDIRIESRVGEGTTVRVYVPAARA